MKLSPAASCDRHAGFVWTCAACIVAANDPAPQRVGLVCSCGRAVATIPGVTAECSGCGAVWLVSALLIVPAASR